MPTERWYPTWYSPTLPSCTQTLGLLFASVYSSLRGVSFGESTWLVAWYTWNRSIIGSDVCRYFLSLYVLRFPFKKFIYDFCHFYILFSITCIFFVLSVYYVLHTFSLSPFDHSLLIPRPLHYFPCSLSRIVASRHLAGYFGTQLPVPPSSTVFLIGFIISLLIFLFGSVYSPLTYFPLLLVWFISIGVLRT